MATLVMVRTVCCESFKCNGVRCAICPNRPENREAVEQYKQKMAGVSLGRRYQLPVLPSQPAEKFVAGS
jgi:hypothetical protein